MPESDTDIRVSCPRCEKRVRVPVAYVGRVLKCPKCNASFQCPPEVEPAAEPLPEPAAATLPDDDRTGGSALVPAQPTMPALRTRYCTGLTVSGIVVGLERVREQHVEGRGELRGSFGAGGYYKGPSGFPTMTGPSYPGHGHFSAGGNVYGESRTWTRYEYNTYFHIRGADGIDHAVHVPWVEYLPVLDGHAVTGVYLRNDRGQDQFVALVNHSAAGFMELATEQDILAHLDLHADKEVRRELVSAVRTRRLRGERAAVLAEHGPWALLFAGIGGLLCGLGLVVGASSAAVGVALGVAGLLGVLAGLGWYIYLLTDKWEVDARPTTETVRVRNDTADRELELVRAFILDVARAGEG